MHLTDLDEDFLDLLANKPADVFSVAAVVGDISRTWFDDKTLMVDLFSMIQEHDPEFYLAQHGTFGFDLAVRDAATCAGIHCVGYADEVPRAERFDFKTYPSNLLAAGWMLLVLVRRNEKGDLFERCWNVDSAVFEVALELGMPVFAVTEGGVVRAVP